MGGIEIETFDWRRYKDFHNSAHAPCSPPDVLLDGDPAIIDVDAWAENVDPLKHALVLLQDETDERHSFARLAVPKEDARAWHQGHHGVRGLLAGVLRRGEKLDLPHSSFCVTQVPEAGS